MGKTITTSFIKRICSVAASRGNKVTRIGNAYIEFPNTVKDGRRKDR